MFLLSPPKLIVVLVVALLVLGPDKLPKVAKQLGTLWSDFRTFRERLESEARVAFPDLPSTNTITQAVRSPLTFLDSLTDDHDENCTAPTVHPEKAGSRGTDEVGTPAGSAYMSQNGSDGLAWINPMTEVVPPVGDVLCSGDLAHRVAEGLAVHDAELN